MSLGRAGSRRRADSSERSFSSRCRACSGRIFRQWRGEQWTGSFGNDEERCSGRRSLGAPRHLGQGTNDQPCTGAAQGCAAAPRSNEARHRRSGLNSSACSFSRLIDPLNEVSLGASLSRAVRSGRGQERDPISPRRRIGRNANGLPLRNGICAGEPGVRNPSDFNSRSYAEADIDRSSGGRTDLARRCLGGCAGRSKH